jgi:hypothetical protein
MTRALFPPVTFDKKSGLVSIPAVELFDNATLWDALKSDNAKVSPQEMHELYDQMLMVDPEGHTERYEHFYRWVAASTCSPVDLIDRMVLDILGYLHIEYSSRWARVLLEVSNRTLVSQDSQKLMINSAGKIDCTSSYLKFIHNTMTTVDLDPVEVEAFFNQFMKVNLRDQACSMRHLLRNNSCTLCVAREIYKAVENYQSSYVREEFAEGVTQSELQAQLVTHASTLTKQRLAQNPNLDPKHAVTLFKHNQCITPILEHLAKNTRTPQFVLVQLSAHHMTHIRLYATETLKAMAKEIK